MKKIKRKLAILLTAVLLTGVYGNTNGMLTVYAETGGYADDTVALLIKQDNTTTEYTTLAEACSAATDSTDTIKLLKDSAVTLSREDTMPGSGQPNVYFGGKAGTYDLNGKTVSIKVSEGADPMFSGIQLASGDKTIKNGTIDADLGNSYYFNSYTFENVTFTQSQRYWGCAGKYQDKVNITIRGSVCFKEGITEQVGYNKLTIEKDSALYIAGNMPVTGSGLTPELINNGAFYVGGISSAWPVDNVNNYGSIVTNSENGVIHLKGAVTDDVTINNSGTIYLYPGVTQPTNLNNIGNDKIVNIIDNISISDIDAPLAGTSFDKDATVGDTTKYSATVKYYVGDTEDTNTNAGYNKTYTAKVTVTPAAGYEFASAVTATVNGENATSVTKNDDGTLTVSYAFAATDKEVVKDPTPEDPTPEDPTPEDPTPGEPTGPDTPKDPTPSVAHEIPHISLTEDGGTWDGNRYTRKDGTMATDVFFFDGAYTYYLQADGTPMKDTLTYHPDGEHIIYLNSDGHIVYNAFQYCPSVGYTCYFGSEGYIYKDQITFVGDKTYYLNANGKLENEGWFQFANGRDYGYANWDGTLMTNGFSYDPWGRVVFFHWNGMVARGLITDGVWYYNMDETDGHYLGRFQVQ